MEALPLFPPLPELFPLLHLSLSLSMLPAGWVLLPPENHLPFPSGPSICLLSFRSSQALLGSSPLACGPIQLYQMVMTFSCYNPPILHVPSLTCGPGLSSSPLIPQSHKLPLVEGPNTCGLPPVQHFFLLPWPRLQPLALCPAFTLLALLQGNSDQVNVLLCSRGSSTRGSCLPPEQAPTPRCLSKLPVPLRSEPSFPYLWIFL